MQMKDKEIKQLVESGWIHSRLIIEMLGAPKEHVESTLKNFIDKLRKEEDVKVLKEDFTDAEKKDKFFAAFVEVELLVKGVDRFSWVCFDYMPSSVEILDPESFNFEALNFAQFMNDLMARLHNMDMGLKNANAESILMRNNMDALMQNFVYLSIKHSPKSTDVLAAELGIDSNFAEMVIAKLIERNVVRENDGIYEVVNNKE